MRKASKDNNYPILVSFRTTEEQKKQVAELAAREMCSEATILRKMIKEFSASKR